MKKLLLASYGKFARHDVLASVLLALTCLVAFGVLVLPVYLEQANATLVLGQVAEQDYQATADQEYISEIRTTQARDAAERAVSAVYSAPDLAISRRQVSRLRNVLDLITTIRDNPAATNEQKIGELAGVSDITLSPESQTRVMAMSNSRWSSTQQDAIRLLEALMRASVREENMDTLLASIPSLVSFTLTEEQSVVVTELVSAFIVPNSFYNEEATLAARQQARQAIEPFTQTYVAGEIVVRRGKVISDVDMEALEQLGIIRPADPAFYMVGFAAIVAVSGVFVGVYFHRRRPAYYNDGRSLLLIALLFIVFLAAARIIIPERAVIPYVYPLPAFAILLATLFGSGAGMILSLVLSILAAFGLPNALDLTIYYLLSSLLGVLSLGKAHRVSSFLWSAIASATAGMTVITAYRVAQGNIDALGYATLLGASLLNGIASASIALLLQHLFAEFLGLTTALRLLEISRPDSPLLQYFLRNAPGTYQHSLMVANLAEQAAEKLGLDTLLVRVGALYHDVGKATNPSFFIENQLAENLNPHHDLPPEEASANVIRHVTDGVRLAKKFRLPRRMIDFMLEHHGTMMTRYYYHMAVQNAGGDPSKVDAEKFRYPGPRPRSRETALLMLADNIEARARSERPRTEEELRAVVQKGVDFCLQESQLAETRFTFKDLTIISDVFVTTLQGLYHPRIRYPSSEPPLQPEGKP